MENSYQRDDVIRFSMRRRLVGVAIIAVLFAVARFSIRAYNSIPRSFENFSAIWLTHDMLTTYLARTNGEWPENWDDLQPIFDSPISQPYGAPDLDWVRERITLDFDIDPVALANSIETKDRPLHAIRMADGTENGETRSANEGIKSAILKRSSP